ncbi:MAG TPA: hypothetical protein PLS63_00430 [Microthrixaceae bacterium]|nr:hypothetical protein [Microthrixaceae bacterium]
MTHPVFVDTSALYALMDRQKDVSADAQRIWVRLLDGDIAMFTHSAVVTECSALVQRRLGIPALRDLHERILPVISPRYHPVTFSNAGQI